MRDLSTGGLWYPRGSCNLYPTDTKGRLYILRSCAHSAPPEGDRTRLGRLSTAFQLLLLFWPHTRNSPDLRPWPLPTSSSSFSWKTWLLCLSFALLKQVLHYPYFIILTGVNSASQMGHKQPAKGLALKSLNTEDWIELAIQWHLQEDGAGTTEGAAGPETCSLLYSKTIRKIHSSFIQWIRILILAMHYSRL